VINTGTEPMTISARFKICVSDVDKVPFPGNSFTCTTTAINVPDAAPGKAVATCTAPEDMDIWEMASHAHNHLTKFTMQFYDGQKTHDEFIYESDDWDSPKIVNLEEPLHLKKGQGITYTCNYMGPVMFADDAAGPTAEHCGAFLAYEYPPGREFEVPIPLTAISFQPGQVAQASMSLPQSPL
jgi:hypothetical protein